MKKWDFIIIVGAIIVAGSLYFSGLLRSDIPGGTAVIYVDGEEKTRLSLLKNQEFKVETKEGYNIIEIKDGIAYVRDADCRDKICVNTAPVSKLHESITCLPHKVVVEIEGTEEGHIDAIVQ